MSTAATPAGATAGPEHGARPATRPAVDDGARLAVAVYSDKSTTRDKVRRAVGRRPAADLPLVEISEFATLPALLRAVDSRRFDVVVLDGEAAPAGGLGVCRQLHDEIYDCPPVLVLTGRPQDAWLAAWSRAEAAVPHPLDPRAVADAVASLARRRVATPPPA